MARASIEEAPARPIGHAADQRAVLVRPPLSDADHRANMSANYPEVRLDLRFSERFVNLVEEGIELALRIGQLEVEHADGAAARHGAALSGRDAGLSAAGGRCRARRKTSSASMHRLFAAARRPMNGPSNPSTAATSPSIGGPLTGRRCRRDGGSGDATSRHRHRCRPGARAPAFAAARCRACCRIFRSPPCRCTRSIRRRTGCRCGREAFSTC